MRLSVALTNIVLGSVYTSYGIITIADLRRGWRTLGELHFGLAWIAMAFTCGPHHLEHGWHTLTDGTAGGGFDLAMVLAGFPAGVTWFLLRVEAFRGGRGDRSIERTPRWVAALPYAGALYTLLVIAAVWKLVAPGITARALFVPNLWLLWLYVLIGFYLLRTQFAAHRVTGGWSLSGLSLGVVFPTCAVMHVAWVVYAATGLYDLNRHLLLIDWLSVPAALYFVWVVRALYRGDLAEREPEPVMLAAA